MKKLYLALLVCLMAAPTGWAGPESVRGKTSMRSRGPRRQGPAGMEALEPTQGGSKKEGPKTPVKTKSEKLAEALVCTPCAYAQTSSLKPCPMQLVI